MNWTKPKWSPWNVHIFWISLIYPFYNIVTYSNIRCIKLCIMSGCRVGYMLQCVWLLVCLYINIMYHKPIPVLYKDKGYVLCTILYSLFLSFYKVPIYISISVYHDEKIYSIVYYHVFLYINLHIRYKNINVVMTQHNYIVYFSNCKFTE